LTSLTVGGPAVRPGRADHRLSHLAIQQFGLCTATCSTSAKNSSRIPAKPATCCGSAFTACRSANSPAAKPHPHPASYDGATELERGLGILLPGLTTTLIPQAT
jgi:hypothetical protein